MGRDREQGYGFVKLHRSIRSHHTYFLQQKRPATPFEAFIDLMLEAKYKREAVPRDGQVIHVNRGQVLTTEDNLAKRFGWSRGKVRRWLGANTLSGEMQRETVQGLTLITICNYDKWQGDGTSLGTNLGTNHGTHLKKNQERERSALFHKSPEQIEELRQKLGLPPCE